MVFQPTHKKDIYPVESTGLAQVAIFIPENSFWVGLLWSCKVDINLKTVVCFFLKLHDSV